MSKHIPGPWSVYRKKSGFAGLFIIGSIKTVAAVSESDDKAPDEIRANAYLIAAAPELLEALRIAIPYMEESDSYCAAAWLALAQKRDIKLAKAAIAKAEGESQRLDKREL